MKPPLSPPGSRPEKIAWEFGFSNDEGERLGSWTTDWVSLNHVDRMEDVGFGKDIWGELAGGGPVGKTKAML